MTSRANQSVNMSIDSINDDSFTSFKSNIMLNSNKKNPRISPQKALSREWSIVDARKQLRAATIMLSNRGLKLAARWAAEQLNGLKFEEHDESTQLCSVEPEDDTKCSDLELYAKSILDLGEYYRAASTLSINPIEEQDTDVTGVRRRYSSKGGDLTVHPPKNNLTSYGIYLRAYALFMAGERRKEEEVLELR